MFDRGRKHPTGPWQRDGGQLSTRPQPRVRISKPGDRGEREADHVAESLDRQEPPRASAAARSQETLARPPAGWGDHGAAALDVGGPGAALPSETRAAFEARLQLDLSRVRIHAGESGATSAHRLGARGATAGNHIVFAPGEFAPTTRAGQRLLAHELTHVMQQMRAPASMPTIQRTPAGEGRDLHHGMAEDVRRWTGMAWSEQEGQGKSPSDFALARRALKSLTRDQAGMRLQHAVMELTGGRSTLLQPSFVSEMFSQNPPDGELATAINAVLDTTNPPAPTGGAAPKSADFRDQMLAIEAAAPKIMAILERKFILSPKTSSLDLLPGGRGAGYRNFKWGNDDYVGNGGANTGKAQQMVDELSQIRPERRAHVGKDAAVTQEGFNESRASRLLEDIPPLPADVGGGAVQPPGKLHRAAVESFVRMREAALKDGVVLIVLFAHRSVAAARSAAGSAGRPTAVAAWSAHSAGLAGDFRMSIAIGQGAAQKSLSFGEAETHPMSKVVEMRESPAHKWLFIHGAEYGWYPYQHEPWHFEYNPPGLKDTYWK